MRSHQCNFQNFAMNNPISVADPEKGTEFGIVFKVPSIPFVLGIEIARVGGRKHCFLSKKI